MRVRLNKSGVINPHPPIGNEVRISSSTRLFGRACPPNDIKSTYNLQSSLQREHQVFILSQTRCGGMDDISVVGWEIRVLDR